MIRYDEIIVEKIFLTFVTSNAGHLLLKWSLMLNGPLIRYCHISGKNYTYILKRKKSSTSVNYNYFLDTIDLANWCKIAGVSCIVYGYVVDWAKVATENTLNRGLRRHLQQGFGHFVGH